MKSKIALFMLTTLCVTFLFAGCSSDMKSVPISTSVLCSDDFKITFSSKQSVYKKADIDKQKPLDFEIVVEYVGDKAEIQVWHSNTIGIVSMRTENNENILNIVTEDVCVTSIFKPNEPLVIKWSGNLEYKHLGSFNIGTYKAEAFVEFRLSEFGSNPLKCVLELPFVIE